MSKPTRQEQAEAVYRQGLERVATTPAPEGQKFPCGSRVRIADDLGPAMSHFKSGANATVLYTYTHAYGGGGDSGIKSYALDIDGFGDCAWYHEHQLTAIEDDWPQEIGE